MSRRLTVLYADSTADMHGVDMGGKMHVVAWNRRDGFVTVKIEGGKFWSGIGQQSYAPTRFETYRILSSQGREDRAVLDVERVIDHPLRATPLDLTQEGTT